MDNNSLEQAIRDFQAKMNNEWDDILVEKAIKFGYNFANKWLNIKESLPENQDIVLVKTDKGSFATAYYHGKSSGFIVYGDEAYVDFGTITHWKSINI